jgi:RNA polymerase sigma factor (sigma-70 family)
MKASFTRENGVAPLSPEDQKAAVAAVIQARESISAANDAKSKREARQAYAKAVDHLVSRNQNLVRMYARRASQRCRSLDFDDLVQVGNLGLLEAIEKYDPEHKSETTGKSVVFGTYAVWWILALIQREITHLDPLIRVPANVLDDRRTLNRHVAAWEAKEGRTPDLAELAGEVITERDASGTYRLKVGKGIHHRPTRGTIRGKHVAERIQKVLDVNLSTPASMDESIRRTGSGGSLEVTRHDLTPTDLPSPEEIVARREREAMALGLVAELPMRERTVITARFWEEKTLEEIGAVNHGSGVGKFGKSVTRERVRQIEFEAMRMLREKAADAAGERA